MTEKKFLTFFRHHSEAFAFLAKWLLAFVGAILLVGLFTIMLPESVSESSASEAFFLSVALLVSYLFMEGHRSTKLQAVFRPLQWPARNGPPLGWGILLSFAISTFLGAAIEFLPGFEEMLSQYEDLFADETFISGVLGFTLIPVFEELVCRGVLFRGLLARSSFGFAAIVSSLIFGFIHMIPLQIIDASIGGLVFAWLYYHYRSLWAPILAHMVNNIMAFSIPSDHWIESYGVLTTLTIGLIGLIGSLLIIRMYLPLKHRENHITRMVRP